MDNFKVILEAVIDNSSLTDAQKKIAKEHFKADLSLDLDLNEFAKQKKNIKEQTTKLTEELKTAFKNAKFSVDDKELETYAKDFLHRIQQATKEQEKLNKLQEKHKLAEQEKYYGRIADNLREIYSLKEKLLTANKQETEEIENQIRSLNSSKAANYGQINKKGLSNKDWQHNIDSLEGDLKDNYKYAVQQDELLRQSIQYYEEERNYQKARENAQLKNKEDQEKINQTLKEYTRLFDQSNARNDEDLLRQSIEYYEQERYYQYERSKALEKNKADQEAYNASVKENLDNYSRLFDESDAKFNDALLQQSIDYYEEEKYYQEERAKAQAKEKADREAINNTVREYAQLFDDIERQEVEAENVQKQAIDAKEKAYQDAYKELKKLYDLRIEFAKIDEPDSKQKYLYENAINEQEKVWRNAYANTSEPENWDVQKRLELQRQEVAMQEKLEHAYGRVTEAKKQAQKVDEIQLSMSGEGKNSYSLELARITEQYKRLGLEGDKLTKANENVKALEDAHNELAKAIAKDVSEYGSLEAKNKAIISADENRIAVLNRVINEYKEMALTAPKVLTDIQRLNKAESMQKWADGNSKAMKKYGNDINRIIQRFQELEIQMNSVESDKLIAEFKDIQNIARQSHLLGMTTFDKLKNAWEKFGGWSLATGALTKVLQGMKAVFTESVRLNTAITDLTMATGKNGSEIQKLVSSYSELGDKLNATLTDVIESGTEWLKQGEDIANTETLITNAMILSKIAKLSSADSTKYLTSAMKGYGIAAQDTLDVVDKMSAVDMASATSVSGLAEGMSQVAKNANLAGVSMDKLLGYLAVIGETTQSSMSEVGTSLNAIFSRMGNIKLSRLKDYETGEDLSNVETVLRGEGIILRESTGEFRNFGEVLDEVAGRWTNFSEVSQRAIASAFAGTNHMENFLVLMEGYGKAAEYATTSMESSGEAMQKFSEYQKSVTAHTELFTKAVQDLAQTAVNSGLVNWFIDLGTIGVKAIDGLVGGLTPLGTILTTLGGYLGAKNLG